MANRKSLEDQCARDISDGFKELSNWKRRVFGNNLPIQAFMACDDVLQAAARASVGFLVKEWLQRIGDEAMPFAVISMEIKTRAFHGAERIESSMSLVGTAALRHETAAWARLYHLVAAMEVGE